MRINLSSIKYSFYVSIVCLTIIACAMVFSFSNTFTWNNEYKNLLKFSCILTGLFVAFSGLSKMKFRTGIVIFACLVFMLMGFTASLVGVALFWFACWGVGFSLDYAFRNYISESGCKEDISLHLITGYIALTLILTVLAYTPYNTPLIFGLLFFVPVFFALKKTIQNKSDHEKLALGRPDFEYSSLLFSLPLNFALCLLLSLTLLPDLGSDAINSYRSIINELTEKGSFNYDPEISSIRLLSLSGIWPHSFAAIMSGEYESAKLLNYSILLATVFIAFDINKASHYSTPTKLALAILLTAPIINHITNSAFYDNTMIFLVVGLIFLTEKLKHAMSVDKTSFSFGVTYHAILLGLLSTLLIITKYTTVFVVPALAAYILFRLYNKEKIMTLINISIIIAIVVSVLWGAFLFFVYHKTGNPIFPYYNDIFLSQYYGTEVKKSPHPGYLSIRMLWDITFETSSYSTGSRNGVFGVIAVVWLATTAFFLAFRKSINSRQFNIVCLSLVCFLLGVIFMSAFQNNVRYLVLLFPFLLTPLVIKFETVGRINALIITASVVAIHLFLFPHFSWNIINAKGVFKNNHAEIVSAYRADITVSDKLSEMYGASGRVMFFNNNAGFVGRAFINSWYDDRTAKAFYALDYTNESDVLNFLKSNQIDAVVVSKDEMRAFLKGRENQFLKIVEQHTKLKDNIGGVTIFHLENDIALNQEKPLNFEVKTENFVVFSLQNVSDIEASLEFTCSEPATFRFVAIKPSGKWYYTKSYVPKCNGEIEKMNFSYRDLDIKYRKMLMVLPRKDSEFQLVSGSLHSR